jgi:hypothetical protein
MEIAASLRSSRWQANPNYPPFTRFPGRKARKVDFAKFGPITSIIGRAGAPISHNNGPDVCSGE